MTDNALRPLRSGDLEAQAVVRLPLRLKRAAEAAAERLGITTSEWWRRAARAALLEGVDGLEDRKEGEP